MKQNQGFVLFGSFKEIDTIQPGYCNNNPIFKLFTDPEGHDSTARLMAKLQEPDNTMRIKKTNCERLHPFCENGIDNDQPNVNMDYATFDRDCVEF